VFIKHPPENLMASFNFTSVVLDEGTTFIFGQPSGFNHNIKAARPFRELKGI
jgi:hypothetical protein